MKHEREQNWEAYWGISFRASQRCLRSNEIFIHIPICTSDYVRKTSKKYPAIKHECNFSELWQKLLTCSYNLNATELTTSIMTRHVV